MWRNVIAHDWRSVTKKRAMLAKLQGSCQQEIMSAAVIQADEKLWVAGDSRQEICTKQHTLQTHKVTKGDKYHP
jgi:porphobilinogen deaminase